MCLMVIHSADGTDQSSMRARGVDTNQVHDFSGVKTPMMAMDVLKRVFFDGLSD